MTKKSPSSSFIRRRDFHMFFGAVAGLLIVISPYVNWDIYTRMFLVVLAGYVSFHALPLFINGGWVRYAPTLRHRVILMLVILYATFACTYNQVARVSAPWRISALTIVFVLLWLLFWALAPFAFMQGLARLQRRFPDKASTRPGKRKPKPKLYGPEPSRKGLRLLWLRVSGITLLGYSFWLFVCHPGNVAVDGFSQWAQLQGAAPLSDAHPIINLLFYGIFTFIYNSPFTPILAQTIIQCAIWGFIAVALRKAGATDKICYVMAAAVGFAPNNGIMTATLIKDTLFAVSILALLLCLCNVILRGGKISLFQSAMTAFAIFFTAMTRHNGIVPAVFTAIFLIFYLKKYRKAVPIIAVGLVIITQQIIYPSVAGVRSGQSGFGALMIFSVGSVFYYGGNIPPGHEAALTEFIPREKWVEDFHPYLINPYDFADDPIIPTIEQNFTDSQIRRIYLDLLLANPALMIKHHLAVSDINWAVLRSTDPRAYNVTAALGIIDNEFGIASSFPGIIDEAARFLTASYDNTFMYSTIYTDPHTVKLSEVILWQAGIYIILSLLLAYYAFLNKKYAILAMMIPIFSNFAALMVFSLAQDYRYSYQVFLTFPFIFIFYLVTAREDLNENANNNPRLQRGGKPAKGNPRPA